MLQAAGLVAVAVVVAAMLANGTFAFLNASKPVPLVTSGGTSATITAGTATLATSTPSISFVGLYPGESRQAEFTVTNTGTADLALSLVSITGFGSTGTTATLARGTCASGAPQIANTGGSLGVTAARTTTVTVCLRVSMPATAPATGISKSATLVVALSGVQP